MSLSNEVHIKYHTSMFIDPILSCSQTKLLFMQRIHNYNSATEIVKRYQA